MDISEMQQKIVNDNLIDAVRNDDRAKIDLCLKKGANINARWSGYRNRTPLMLAVAYGNKAETAFILARNPDLFLKDNDGKTVFDICAEVSDATARAAINKMLLEALPDAAPAAPADTAAVQDDRDITILKPLELAPRKKPGGPFSL